MADHQTDDEQDDLLSSDSDTALAARTTLTRPTAADALAQTALDSALTRERRAIMRRSPSVIIVKTSDSAWTEIVCPVLARGGAVPATVIATEASTRRGERQRTGGGEALRTLNRGKSIIFVSHDPETMLDEVVLAAVDATIVIPALSPALLRKAIGRVTGGVARDVTAAMVALDLPTIMAALRPGLSARQCVDNLKRAIGRTPLPDVQSAVVVPFLSELPLTPPVRAWTDQMLAEMEAVKRGVLQPKELVYGVLEGPPGCGKTLVAESLARTAGWTFVSSSVGGWFTSGGGALGDVSRNIKGFIDEVLASEPAVGFLDEIEAVPDRATLDARAREWWTPVVTLVLTEIDRLRRSGKKVALLGATNYYHRLDAALVRPGRLQQRVSVQPPQTDAELMALMRFHLGKDLTDADLGKLVQPARGATPAMVEGWGKAARASARVLQRGMVFADLLDAVAPRDDRLPRDIRTIAIHECGHALVALRIGYEVKTISMIPVGDAGGLTVSVLQTLVPTWQDTLDRVTIALAGRAADMVFGRGPNAGAEQDLAGATQALLDALERQGLGHALVSLPARSPKPVALLDTVNDELHKALKRATNMLEAERERFVVLVERLIEARALSGEETLQILGPPPGRKRRPLGNPADGLSSVIEPELRRGNA